MGAEGLHTRPTTRTSKALWGTQKVRDTVHCPGCYGPVLETAVEGRVAPKRACADPECVFAHGWSLEWLNAAAPERKAGSDPRDWEPDPMVAIPYGVDGQTLLVDEVRPWPPAKPDQPERERSEA